MPFVQAPIIKSHSAGIDVLRVALALWVVVIHLVPAAEIAQQGAVPTVAMWLVARLNLVFQPRAETHPAVLAFIVLSGYCIHRNGIRLGQADLAAYAVRRIFRIYPVYLLAVVLGILAAAWTNAAAPQIAPLVTGTTTAGGACAAAKLVGLPAVVPGFYPCSLLGNTPLSTVVVEIYLYAAYPLVLLLIGGRYGDRGIWSVVVVSWAAQFAFVVMDPDLAAWWHNSSFFGYLFYWWIGAKFVEAEAVEKGWRYIAPLAGAWIILSLVLLKRHEDLLLLVEARKLVFAVLVGFLIATVDRGRLVNRIDPGAFGRSGYSLYALHAPILYVLLVLGAPWWLAGIVAILVASLFYRAVEEPMIGWGKMLARKQMLARSARGP